MTSLDHRIEMAAHWFGRTQSRSDDGYGWGWVSDVPPNPQNTAEVICALRLAGLPVPHSPRVEQLVRSPSVGSSRGEWIFQEAIDVGWRIRALRSLNAPADDPELVASVEALLSLEAPSGGWQMAGREGPVSVTATANAILALLDDVDGRAVGAIERATLVLVGQLTGAANVRPAAFEAAHAAYVLCQPQVAHLAGGLVPRAQTAACRLLLDYLSQRTYEVEEEMFSRGGIIDSWRHLTLPLSLRSLAAARPDVLFHPDFRAGLVALLALQDPRPSHANFGGFRSSPEGFVTSYATTQAVEVLSIVRRDLNERISPAMVFDFMCHRRGAHHADPQTVAKVGKQSIIMNGAAALAVMLVSLLAGVSLVLGAELPAIFTRTGASRTFLVLGSLIGGLGVSAYVSARMHQTPNQKVALISFTLFTSLVLPILTFVLD